MGDRVNRVRRLRANPIKKFFPGQTVGVGSQVHGGGGPENAGARNEQQGPNPVPFTQNQPSWAWEDSIRGEYFGPAAPSVTPNLAGCPANNFRTLGDLHGGRA